jgi:hypothetical protein
VFRYARVWLWHMVAGFLFSDRSGNTISWLVLLLLRLEWDVIGTYNWGSAALAWLYHALCDECSRIRLNTNLGGCTYLLQIWMWEHISIARSYRHAPQVCSSYLFSLYIFFVDCVLLTLWNIIFSHGHLRMSNPNPYWVTAGQGSRTSQAP